MLRGTRILHVIFQQWYTPVSSPENPQPWFLRAQPVSASATLSCTCYAVWFKSFWLTYSSLKLQLKHGNMTEQFLPSRCVNLWLSLKGQPDLFLQVLCLFLHPLHLYNSLIFIRLSVIVQETVSNTCNLYFKTKTSIWAFVSHPFCTFRTLTTLAYLSSLLQFQPQLHQLINIIKFLSS